MTDCVVLGGTGLIGRHVLAAMKDRPGVRLRASRRASPPPPEHGDVDWVEADLRDPDAALTAVGKAEVVICCAGRVASTPVLKADPIAPVLDNMRIGTNVLAAAARAGASQVVVMSSTTGYLQDGDDDLTEDRFFSGDPPDRWYGLGWAARQLEIEARWHAEKLQSIGRAVALRPSMVYGPGDHFDIETGHFLPAMIVRVVERHPVIEIWGSGEQKRDVIHAADVAGAVTACLDSGLPGMRAYNVAAAEQVSVNEIVAKLIEIDDYADAVVTHVDTGSSKDTTRRLNADLIAAETGFRPCVALTDGLRETVQWYRKSRGL